MKKILFVILSSILFISCENSNSETQQTKTVEGALPFTFVLQKNVKVKFSKGNLQYQASTNTWRFADNQYDIIGIENENISSTYSGWIDLFAWGASGYDLPPYTTSNKLFDFTIPYSCLSIGRTKYDWAYYNKISNGGNTEGTWRTLSVKEWQRLFSLYPYSIALVCDIPGVILSPSKDISEIQYYSKKFEKNIFNDKEWKKLENKGCVFFPTAGWRYETKYYYDIEYLQYWTSTAYLNDGYSYFWGYGWNINEYDRIHEFTMYQDLRYGSAVRPVLVEQ